MINIRVLAAEEEMNEWTVVRSVVQQLNQATALINAGEDMDGWTVVSS